MQNALKNSQTEDAESLADDMLLKPDTSSSDVMLTKNISELREKIKSARLEKLMARQLESELSIDGLDISDDITSELHEEETQEDWSSVPEIEVPTQYSNSNTAPPRIEFKSKLDVTPSGTNVNINQSRHACDALSERIRDGLEVFSKLSEHTESLKDYLSAFETEFSNLQQSQERLEYLEKQHKSLQHDHREAFAKIDLQKKQIGQLESRMKNVSGVLDTTRDELKKTKEASMRKDQDNRTLKAHLASSEDAIRSLKNNTASLESTLDEATKANQATLEQLSAKETDVGNLMEQVDVLSDQKRQLKSKLEETQVRYDEVNKRGLEQQSQHYSKVHELEKSIRELRRDVDLAKQDKNQAELELKAANNLLALHEEMLEAISDKAH